MQHQHFQFGEVSKYCLLKIIVVDWEIGQDTTTDVSCKEILHSALHDVDGLFRLC